VTDRTPGDETITLSPIGAVRSTRTQPIDDAWGDVEATIVLDPTRVAPASLNGLEGFSHIEVVYYFHLVDEGSIELGARRPRGNPQWPEVGIFAQRAKGRPNRLGVSCCRLLSIENLRLSVRGLDAIDGSPVLDVKPYMRELHPRGPVTQPSWVAELMRDYW
jgi:tRNA-Thr(GGU) m(6)t(6)A37 methyltransferase TsaA